MKLKKIASLMLAGVMAVSMLAGCSNGTKPDDDKKDPVVDSSLTGKVIAALDEDTTKNVTFTSSSALDATINKTIAVIGTENIGRMVVNDLRNVDDELGENSAFAYRYETNKKDNADAASKDAKVTVIVDAQVPAGASEDYAVKQIAKAIDNDSVVKNLETDSVTFTVDTDGDGKNEEFWYNWTYTGNISVVKVENAQTGVVSYVVVYTMNRTAEKDSK